MGFVEYESEWVDSAPSGIICMTYSGTGVGKTVSALRTLQTPIAVINNEPRDIRRAIAVVEAITKKRLKLILKDRAKANGDILIYNYTGDWGEARKVVETFDFSNYASILMDGATEASKNAANNIRNDELEATKEEDKEGQWYLRESQLSKRGYGATANQMDRLMKPLVRWAQAGKHIVINALLADAKKEFQGSFIGKPMFVGQMFGNEIPGCIDIIGMSTRRYKTVRDGDGQNIKDKYGNDVLKLVYPPWIAFEPKADENFECKWTGKRVCLPGCENLPEDEWFMKAPLDYGIWFGLKKYDIETGKWIYHKDYNRKEKIEKKSK